MKKIGLILCFVCFCLVPFVFGSDYDYVQLGGDQQNFNVVPFNEFSSNNIDDFTYSVGLDNGQGLPLVNDLDGDGTKEIVVLSNNNVLLFHFLGGSLDFVDSYALKSHPVGFVDNYFSNLVLFDANNDGKKEIILHSDYYDLMYFLGYNGSDLFNVSTLHEFGLSDYSEVGDGSYVGVSMIGCGSNGCLLVGTQQDIAFGSSNIKASGFNLSHINTMTIQSVGVSPFVGCLPSVRYLIYSDVNDLYYFTYSFNGVVWVKAYDIDSDLLPVETYSVTNSDGWSEVGLCSGLRGEVDQTNIEVGQFNIYDDTYEVGFGLQIDPDEFKLYVYSYDLNLIDDYPDFSQANGILKSNPFMARAVNVGGGSDNWYKKYQMCVVGYDDVNGLIDILCAFHPSSYNLGGLFIANNLEFEYSNVFDYNISKEPFYNVVAHSVESDLNNGMTEVLTPFGIFELQSYAIGSEGKSTCYQYGFCSAFLLYDLNVNTDYAFIMSDVEGTLKPDIIGLNSDSLIYIDDGYSNLDPFLLNTSYIKPCLDYAWNLGTRVKVVAVPVDVDTPPQNVRAKAILFYGENFSINTSWSDYYSSGSSINLDITYNVSPVYSNGLLRVFIQDSFDNSSDIHYDYFFDVSENGINFSDSCVTFIGESLDSYLFGSCEADSDCDSGFVCSSLGVCEYLNDTCVYSSDCPTDYVCYDSSCVESFSVEDNSVKSSIENISYLTGLPIVVFVLLLLAIITYSVFREPSIGNNVKLPVIIILNLFGLGVFTYLGLLSVLWIVLLVLLVVGFLSIVILKVVGGR